MMTLEKYQTIRNLNKQGHCVLRLCKLLKVSQSGYYDFLKRGVSARSQRRNHLKKKVKQLFHLHKKRYGRIRIHRVCLNQGINISEKMVGSIMRELKLVARKKRPYRPKTTQPGRAIKSVPNLLIEVVSLMLPVKFGFY